MIDHTFSEKEKGLRRVIYCINMVVYTFGYLSKDKSDQNEYNTHLESFLTHVRNLHHFFYGIITQRQDDIVVSDFTGKILTRKYEDNIVGQINKSLSHLTYFKIDTHPQWNYIEITNEFFPICLHFLEDSCLDQFELDNIVSEVKLELINYLRKNKVDTQALNA